jgi:hypothetical protein
MCFVWISERTAIISLYNINWLVFITETQCVYCAVRTESLYIYVPPDLTFTNSTFCPHSVFTCFMWISEQTAIISLYSINWLVFITETDCVYCAVVDQMLMLCPKPTLHYHCTSSCSLPQNTQPPHPQRDQHLVTMLPTKPKLNPNAPRLPSAAHSQHSTCHHSAFFTSDRFYLATCLPLQKDERALYGNLQSS